MKYWFPLLILLVFSGCVTTGTGRVVSLQDAIGNSVEKIAENVPSGARIMIENIESFNDGLSEYIRIELANAIINKGLFVLDRQNQERINQELLYMPGLVSNETPISFGRVLSAQFAVTGRLSNTGDSYLFQTYVINIETTLVINSTRFIVRKDRQMEQLLATFADQNQVNISGQEGLRNTALASDESIEGALARAANQVLRNVPRRSAIAIVYIIAHDQNTTDYLTGELEFIWVNEGYVIIDRSQLDQIRHEQNLQMSGEVDDETAVSIGKFAGANIIVTGRVDGEGVLRRLRLRALDTQTARVLGVASERI